MARTLRGVTEMGSDGVSLDKTNAVGDGSAPADARPKQAVWVVAALIFCGLAALVASVSLYGLHSFLVHQLDVSNMKLKPKDRKTHAEIVHTASVQPSVSMVQSVLFSVVLLFVARAVWRGRYWARWGVIGLWVLATLTSIYGGLFQLSAITANAPVALKLPISLSSAGFVVAVALVSFSKPLVAWLNLTRPDRRPVGGAPARRGMFAQRDPVRAARQGVSTASPLGSRKVRETAARGEDLFRGDANTERARAKARATTETMQRGAAAARTRAKSGKSRRTGQ